MASAPVPFLSGGDMGKLVLYGVGGIVAIAVIFKVVMAILAPLLALVWFVVAKVLPLVLLGWLVVWAWRRWKEQTA
jgi:hypothetical protein